MTALFSSPSDVVRLLAHLLLIGAGLVLVGFACQSRRPAARLCFGAVALAFAVAAILLAESWPERALLLSGGLIFAPALLGLVVIRESQVGVVIKKFSPRSLPAGQFIALDGEAGYQADTLPPGVHFGRWFWQFSIVKFPVVVVPQGEVALVVAAAGIPIPAERILAKVVACDSFQDARKFLLGGGEKGRQLGLLTAGTYRINPAMFQVITGRPITLIQPDQVGIVTTLDGRPIDPGEIAGPLLGGHENFQNAQAFIAGGGRRGLQEQVLLSGSWNLNPWFAQVEQVPMLSIPIGSVGVVISFVGLAHEDVSGAAFKHGDLVNVGHKGVWVSPLYPGKHPVNTRVMRVELVPTTNIVLNWANRTEAHHFEAAVIDARGRRNMHAAAEPGAIRDRHRGDRAALWRVCVDTRFN